MQPRNQAKIRQARAEAGLSSGIGGSAGGGGGGRYHVPRLEFTVQPDELPPSFLSDELMQALGMREGACAIQVARARARTATVRSLGS